MTDVLVVIFWIGIVTALYSYAGFPLLALAFAPPKRQTSAAAAEDAPTVSVTVIIPAYNEERHLAAKIRNTLSADYPRDLLEVLVVSDASTDRTNAVARRFEREGVGLIVQETRRGKTAGLNRAMAVGKSDIAVFTDANAIYPPDAIRRLVAYFRDPVVGLVTGYTRYTSTPDGTTEEATNTYTSLERVIKRTESRWGCCVGADGAIFAMRRSLYRTLREDDINDFVLPLGVIDQGYQCLLADDVACTESPGQSLHSEFRRQSRISNRSLRAICRHAHLLNPLRFPAFSFFLFSHKVVRLMVPLLLVPSAIALVLLAPGGGLYAWFTGGALLLGLAVVVGSRTSRLLSSTRRRGRILRILNVLALTNVAILHGWWRFVSGRSDTTWQPDRVAGARE
jgi:cellulose synthase/poly-beta-1,6-N-acetylglucosamine synthase-like glycosyltransferase